MTDQIAEYSEVPPHDPERGKWIPLLFFAMFGVIISVNAVMVYFAVTSWTGLSTTESFERGRTYNTELARAEAQAALGWRSNLEVGSPAESVLRIEFSLSDAGGAALNGALVHAEIRRPTVYGHDVLVDLTPIGNGRYVHEQEVPLAGNWDVRLFAEHVDGEYRISKRAFVQ